MDDDIDNPNPNPNPEPPEPEPPRDRDRWILRARGFVAFALGCALGFAPDAPDADVEFDFDPEDDVDDAPEEEADERRRWRPADCANPNDDPSPIEPNNC